jgi:hypothetical protein
MNKENENTNDESDAPIVLPVVDRDDIPKEKPIHPHLPKPPCLMLMCSPIRTGKSTILSNIFLNDNFYGQDYFDAVHVLSPTIYADDTSRYLLKFAHCHDGYSDSVIDEIVNYQKSFKEKKDMPAVAICLDDCLGTIRREAKINHLSSKFRHWGIKMLIISSQKFRHVSPVIRTNATAVIVGCPFPNAQELDKIFEEYGDQFGGYDNIKLMYKICCPERYDFMFLNLSENPPLCYHNFTKLVAEGPKIVWHGDGQISEEIKNLNEINNNIDNNKENGIAKQ